MERVSQLYERSADLVRIGAYVRCWLREAVSDDGSLAFAMEAAAKHRHGQSGRCESRKDQRAGLGDNTERERLIQNYVWIKPGWIKVVHVSCVIDEIA